MPGLGLMRPANTRSPTRGVHKSTHKKSPPKLKRECKREFTKKYVSRKSPPYPANADTCRGSTKLGNDGRPYVSTYFSNKKHGGSYRWVAKK